MEHFYILVLNKFVENIFGLHFPKEIIMLIVMMFYRKVKISCGAYYNVVLCGDKIYVWGENDRGQLGLGDDKEHISPTEIIINENIENIESVVCGWDFTVALVADSKKLYIWGSNMNNEMGLMAYSKYHNIYSPKECILDMDSVIKSVSCGQSHTIILLQSGICYSWGLNMYGQLGLGHTNDVDSPQKITLLPLDIIKIGSYSCSLYSTAISKFGKCYMWGSNDRGQLGLGHTQHMDSPQELPLRNVVSISCGYEHAIAITTHRKIYSWGDNDYGQLGLGDNIDRLSPIEPLYLDGIKIESISCECAHTIALAMSGTLYVWGKNDYGQLGLNDSFHRNLPTELCLKESIRSISCGHSHTLCVTSDEKIYVWGSNSRGQLGLGDKIDRFVPCKLPLFS